MKKRSVLWIPIKKEFQEIVNKCNSFADVLKFFNIKAGSGNYNTLHKRIKEENIDVEHIKLGRAKNFSFKMSMPLNEILIVNSSYVNTVHLKQRLFSAGILNEECAECKLGNTWNGKQLTLQIDHINGIRTDNRLENLRILCPNCHTQTITYANKLRIKREQNKCINCGNNIAIKSIRCVCCNNMFGKHRNHKIEWPVDDELLKMVNELNFVQTGKILGVSDVAIRKRLKKNKLL